MNRLPLLLIGLATVLSGCVGYIEPYPDTYSNTGYVRDRDGDGVPNRNDQRPDDPRRY